MSSHLARRTVAGVLVGAQDKRRRAIHPRRRVAAFHAWHVVITARLHRSLHRRRFPLLSPAPAPHVIRVKRTRLAKPPGNNHLPRHVPSQALRAQPLLTLALAPALIRLPPRAGALLPRPPWAYPLRTSPRSRRRRARRRRGRAPRPSNPNRNRRRILKYPRQPRDRRRRRPRILRAQPRRRAPAFLLLVAVNPMSFSSSASAGHSRAPWPRRRLRSASPRRRRLRRDLQRRCGFFLGPLALLLLLFGPVAIVLELGTFRQLFPLRRVASLPFSASSDTTTVSLAR